MRLPASEKLEIISLVEQSHLPARRTLQMLGIQPSTFYRWYDRFRSGGPEALEDKPSKPDRVWNRIPDDVRQRVVMMAFDLPELSPRELATKFIDTNSYYVSESSVYRLLKAHDLIGSPAFIVIKAADEFRDKTTAPNQLWQTDFTYLKVIGWGWYYLSTILDDYSRYIIAWKLCSTMRADDVTDTLELALVASGCDSAKVAHKPRLLSDNGSSYISSDLAEWLKDRGIAHVRGALCHPQTQGKIERWHQTLKNRILLENYYLPGDLEAQIARFVEHYNHRRYHESLQNLTPADDDRVADAVTARRNRPRIVCLSETLPSSGTRKNQKRHHQTATIATSVESRLNSNPNEPEPPSLNSSDCPKPFEDGQPTLIEPTSPRGSKTKWRATVPHVRARLHTVSCTSRSVHFPPAVYIKGGAGYVFRPIGG